MLWLAAGAAFGLAGLSKYSAALNALGLVAFIASVAAPAPLVRRSGALRRRRCLRSRSQAPMMIWNAENNWISFPFRAARGAPDAARSASPTRSAGARPDRLSDSPGCLPASSSASCGLRAARRGDERGLFLVALAAPPIVLFTLTPIWGARGLPHWPMPGWFFLYPLLGRRWLGARRLDRAGGWAFGSAASSS